MGKHDLSTLATASENQQFAYAKTKAQTIFAVTFVFATQIVQSFFFLNPKFQVSSLLLTVQAGLCQTWSETQIVGFLMRRLICEKRHKSANG